ncbi:MAG: DUF3256 family protein [Bacteroidales bacterium]|nr:DUF3256 family protein [Bacteroidales bacterium]
MIKKLIFTLVAGAAAISAQAQNALPTETVTFGQHTETPLPKDSGDTYRRYTGKPAVDAFINAPIQVFPAIDPMTRMDMADYFNSGSPKPSKNNFKGDCRIISADNEQLSFSVSDVSEVELSLLPMKSDTIIMVVTTLKTPVQDSSVKFYSYPEWEPVTKGIFMVPGLDEWTAKDASLPREDLENAVPFILASITYQPATRTLTLENHLGDYLPRENADKVKASLRDRLVYRWTGSRLQPVNSK